jgi:hypothetical protein
MYNRFIIIALLSFIVIGLKAQDTSTKILKKWVLKAEIGATTRGFSNTSFYKDLPNDTYGSLFATDVKILQGIGFHSNVSYGRNFGGRYYLGTSVGFNSQNTSGDYNIETVPLSTHFKINYFKNRANTLYLQGNLGYALPFKTTSQGVNFGYSVGYQFVADKISKHLLGISLQNQVQNIRGVYVRDFLDFDPVTKTIVNYGPQANFGRYKLSGWGLNVAYTF